MTKQLDALEGKVAQVVSLCHSLRAENQELRARLASAEDERLRLVERMEAARVRLEALAEQLPEEGKA
jgi:cell division protein ZapB